MRLSATVPLLALGSVSLLAVGLTSTAARPAAVTAAACSHAGPSISAAAAKRLSQPTSTKDPRPLGETMGEGLGIPDLVGGLRLILVGHSLRPVRVQAADPFFVIIYGYVLTKWRIRPVLNGLITLTKDD